MIKKIEGIKRKIKVGSAEVRSLPVGRKVDIKMNSSKKREQKIFNSSKKQIHKVIKIKRKSSRNLFRKTSPFFKKVGIIIVLLAIVSWVGYALLSHFDRTVIKLTPREELVTLDYTISAYKQPEAKQLGFDIIAISDKQMIEVQASEKVATTEKASGQIVIYNKFSSEPQRLSPETRFETPDGKIFKLGKEAVVIPGKTSDKPGSIEVTIYASEGGEEYNIGLTDFTIPGYKEIESDDRYEKIYALSKTAMTGGAVGERAIVSEMDRRRADNELQNRMKEKFVETMKRQKTEGFLLVEDSMAFSFGEAEVNPNPPHSREGDGQAEESGKTLVEEKGTAIAILINKDKLEEFLANKEFGEEIGDGINITNLESISISSKQEYDAQTLSKIKKVELKLGGEVNLLWEIDLNKFEENILGLEKNDGIEYARTNPGIEEMFIKIYPMWRKEISNLLDKVSISAGFE